MSIFYVYEHWRPDKDTCFYVGKGHGNRARSLYRNPHHRNILKKLSAVGMCIEVRMVRSGLTESEAFDLERERIAFWRGIGVRLTNRTDGGEGPSGMVWSDEAIQKLRKARRRRVFTEADRAAMSRGRIGMKFSAEHRANLAAKKLGKLRKPFTAETIAKMRIAAYAREAAKATKRREAAQ